MPYTVDMQTVIEMPEYLRQAKQLGLSEDEREAIIDELASHPEAGDEVAGTGGMRKLRVAAKGRGKSGGYRVITFFSGSAIPIFLVTVYAKAQKETVTDKEKHAMKSLAVILVETYRRERT